MSFSFKFWSTIEIRNKSVAIIKKTQKTIEISVFILVVLKKK